MIDALEAIRIHAAKRPSRIAIESDDAHWTWQTLLERVEQVAVTLADSNVRCIALAAQNGPDWIAADLAAAMANVTVVPLAPFFSQQQIEHVLSDCAVEAVVVDALGEQLLAKLQSSRRQHLTDRLSMLPIRATANDTGKTRPAKISYTSGTTGSPKGACLSWRAQNLVANSLVAATADLAIARHTCLLPLSVLLENIGGVYAPLICGATIVCPGEAANAISMTGAVNGELLARIVEQTHAESVILLPQLLAALTDGCTAHDCSSLKFAAVGGARTPESLLHNAAKLGIAVYEGYGLTECSSVVCMNAPGASKPGSVGRPLPHARVRIATDGEVFVSGALLDRYNGSESTFSEFATGDIGRFDDDGYLYIQGRKKNVFVTSFGRNVSPEWVETALCTDTAIRMATVFGEARPWNVAVVCPLSDTTSNSAIDAAIHQANAVLPPYARVTSWIRADEPFSPQNGLLTANGRYRRMEIYDRYRQEISACYDRELLTRKAV